VAFPAKELVASEVSKLAFSLDFSSLVRSTTYPSIVLCMKIIMLKYLKDTKEYYFKSYLKISYST